MAKKKATKKESKTAKCELVKVPEPKDVLATIKCPDSKDVFIKREDIRNINLSPIPMVESKLSKELRMQLLLKIKALGIASLSQSKEIQNEAIFSMLGDLVEGA